MVRQAAGAPEGLVVAEGPAKYDSAGRVFVYVCSEDGGEVRLGPWTPVAQLHPMTKKDE